MEIVINGADFSTLGLGNTRWIENYIAAAGITDNTQKTALRALYTSMVAAGLDKKLTVLYLSFGTTPAQDKLNLLAAIGNSAQYAQAYNNDTSAAHTLQGYQNSLASQRYASITIPIAQITNIHLHIFNSTSEAAGGVDRFICGVKDVANGNSLNISLQRNNNGSTVKGRMNSATGLAGSTLSVSSYDTTKTGLFSITKVGTTQKMYDGAAVIKTQTVSGTDLPTLATSTLTMAIGNVLGSTTGFVSDAKVFAFAFGEGIWTDADETTLNTILTTFKAAIGA